MNSLLPKTELPPQLATSLGRRTFLRRSGLAAFTAAMAPAALNSVLNSTPAKAAAFNDVDILNFALNLEYLEAEYYSNAVFGVGLAAMGVGLTGTGTQGTVTIKTSPQVIFENPIVASYAKEIAEDEIAHVKFLRNALSSSAIAEPSIDLLNSFNSLAVAANIGSSFDPFSGDVPFLLGGFIFEDVGVTAYHGAAPFISNPAYLAAAAAILAVEAYHAGEIRTTLYGLNFKDTRAFAAQTANKISDFRDSLDGSMDLDQGITLPDGSSNIVPTNGSSLAFQRTFRQVLNIVYAAPGASMGGFFPAGVNGNIK